MSTPQIHTLPNGIRIVTEPMLGAQSVVAGLTAGIITGGISFVTELAKGASVSDAAKAAAISGVTSAVSVGIASTGVGALYAGGIAAATNAFMQRMVYPCDEVNVGSALFSAMPPSLGGAMLGKSGLKGIAQGTVTGIISGPTTVAGNTFF